MEWKNRRLRIDVILNIFAYVVAIVGFLSMAPHGGLFFSSAFLLLLFLSIMRDMKLLIMIPAFIVNILAVIVVSVAYFRISGDQIILPGLETLLLLLGLKCLDKNESRDHLQIYALAIFLVAGSSLLSLDSSFFIYLVCLIFLLGVANVLLAYYRENKQIALPFRDLVSVIRHSLIIPLLVVPLTLTLFVLLPRTSYPFFSFLNRQAQAGSGFSDHVRLGNISQIQLDDSLVFRAAMERKEERFLYWRGIVLDDFDGLSWRASDEDHEERQNQALKGKAVTYTVYLEPSEYQTLFTIDKPLYVNFRNAIRDADLTFRAPQQISKKISYGGVSVITDTEPAVIRDRERYLLLPPGKEEIRRLGERIGGSKREGEIPPAILAHLLNAPFRYSLKELPQSASPLEDFLFRTHMGNCEYFASAMAVMLRSQGIPARLIGGYRGGYYHEIGQYYSIQQRNAHVWVEAYIRDRGWVRYDPTPSVAVENNGFTLKQLIFRLRMTMDILDYYWNRHVINYDLQQQYAIVMAITKHLQRPKLSNVQWQKALPLLVMLLVMPLLATILFRIGSNYRKLWPTREERLLKRFLALMEKQGLHKPYFNGLEEFLAAAPPGPCKEKSLEFVRIFQDCFYHDRELTKADIQRLESILTHLGKAEQKQ